MIEMRKRQLDGQFLLRRQVDHLPGYLQHLEGLIEEVEEGAHPKRNVERGMRVAQFLCTAAGFKHCLQSLVWDTKKPQDTDLDAPGWQSPDLFLHHTDGCLHYTGQTPAPGALEPPPACPTETEPSQLPSERRRGISILRTPRIASSIAQPVPSPVPARPGSGDMPTFRTCLEKAARGRSSPRSEILPGRTPCPPGAQCTPRRPYRLIRARVAGRVRGDCASCPPDGIYQLQASGEVMDRLHVRRSLDSANAGQFPELYRPSVQTSLTQVVREYFGLHFDNCGKLLLYA